MPEKFLKCTGDAGLLRTALPHLDWIEVGIGSGEWAAPYFELAPALERGLRGDPSAPAPAGGRPPPTAVLSA